MKLSIVIPTLNEAERIGELIKTLQRYNAQCPSLSPLEIVVSDGGSTDATCENAYNAGAQVVEVHAASKKNRGTQMQRGAAITTGEALWFLHADARPHPQSLAAIRRTLANPRTIGGNFRLRFESDLPIARVFERIARLQRLNSVYYGDSGIFVRHCVYRRLGGFRTWPLFEDYDLVRRLERQAKQQGLHTVCLPCPIVASARRFEKRPLRTLGQWALFQTLFAAGVPPQRLAEFYHK